MSSVYLKKSFRQLSKIESIYTGGRVCLTADQKSLVSTCAEEVKLLDIESGQVLSSLIGDTESTTALTVSPDGASIVTASRSLLLRRYELNSSEPTKATREIKAHDSPIADLCYDPTSTLVAAGCSDGTVRVWDIEKGYVTHNFREHSGVVSTVKFFPDPSRLLLFSAADDCTVHIYDLNQKKRIATLSNHVSVVTSIAFSVDGTVLLTGGRDKVVNVWDLQTFKLLKTLPLYETIEAIVVIPLSAQQASTAKKSALDQIRFISGGDRGQLRLWDLASGECLLEQAQQDKIAPIVDVLFASQTGHIIGITSDHTIVFHETTKFQRKKLWVGFNDEILDVKYLDTEHVAVACNSEHLRVFDLNTHACELLSGHDQSVLSVDVSRDGKMIATASKDMTVCIWAKSDSGFRLIAKCGGHTDGVGAVAFSKKSNNFVVTGSEDKTIKLWDLEFLAKSVSSDASTAVVRPSAKIAMVAHTKGINAVGIAPNDTLCATGSQDKTLKIWDTSDFRLLGTCRGHKKGIWHIEFSPVDKAIASCSSDKTIKIWSLTDYSCLKTFEGHSGAVLRCFFVTSGMQLVSTGADGLIKLWTVKTNECVNTFDGHDHKAWALAVSKDQQQIVSGGADSRLIVWEDSTLQEQEEEETKQHEQVQQEQELQNCLREKQWRKAVHLAMQLEQPHRLLHILQEMISSGHIEQLQDVVNTFQIETAGKALSFIRDWNSNSKNVRPAHAMLQCIFKKFKPDQLEKIPDAKKLIEALIAYSNRHFARLDKLIQKSFLLDHTVTTMRQYATVEIVDDEEDSDMEVAPVSSLPLSAQLATSSLKAMGVNTEEIDKRLNPEKPQPKGRLPFNFNSMSGDNLEWNTKMRLPEGEAAPHDFTAPAPRRPADKRKELNDEIEEEVEKPVQRKKPKGKKPQRALRH